MGRKIKMLKIGFILGLCLLFAIGTSGKTPNGTKMLNGHVYAAEAKEYELVYSNPNGNCGYYVTKPEIQITHRDTVYETHYELIRMDHTCKQGVLKEESAQQTIKPEELGEGKNQLTIWMEKPEEGDDISYENGGEKPEKICKKSIEFMVDTEKPEGLQFQYGSEERDIICVQEGFQLGVQAEDKISGIENLVYSTGDGEEHLVDATGVVVIPLGFDGIISFYAVDQAGNTSEVITSRSIICENQAPEVKVTTPKGTDHWYNSDVKVSVQLEESGVASGIQSYGYYIDGVLEGKKEWKEVGRKKEKFTFDVKQKTTGVGGCRVRVESRDLAGNVRAQELVLYMDQVQPQILVNGVTDGQITSQKIVGQIVLKDETQIQSKTIEILQEDEEGKITAVKVPPEVGEEGASKEVKVPITFSEDGIYRLNVGIQDLAGNSSNYQIQTILDQKNPVIRFVEDLNGTELQKFQFGYEPSDMIRDFTHFTYQMRLDKKPYVLGSINQREGIHKLVVTAEDGAGNQAIAKGTFTIDHTKPTVIFQGVEPEGIYEEEATVTIKTKQESDHIQEVLVDGEKQELSLSSEGDQYTLRDAGMHNIEVKAKDRAGNVEQAQIRFEVVEKQGILTRNWSIKEKGKETKIKKSEMAIIFACITGIILLLLVIVTYVRINQRKET